ncbi:MAG: zinc dependent phospholipase C family protein [Clostridia bacterium]|nr:zinc dependent phospholipase C family protein [Clostridia bacterium]
MPDYFSHGIAAEVIYEKLKTEDKKQLNKTLYLVGAQGGDIFFAYKLKPRDNLGRELHRKNAVYLFEQLIEGNLSYAAGYATHYALDSVLHPHVYEYERGKRSPLAHNSFESDLGLYISRKFKMRRQILPKDSVLACTSAVYDSMKHVEPLITITGVERCLKRHFAWTRYSYGVKRQEYKCGFDFTMLDGEIDKAIELGVKAVECVLEKNIDPEIFNNDFLNK